MRKMVCYCTRPLATPSVHQSEKRIMTFAPYQSLSASLLASSPSSDAVGFKLPNREIDGDHTGSS